MNNLGKIIPITRKAHRDGRLFKFGSKHFDGSLPNDDIISPFLHALSNLTTQPDTLRVRGVRLCLPITNNQSGIKPIFTRTASLKTAGGNKTDSADRHKARLAYSTGVRRASDKSCFGTWNKLMNRIRHYGKCWHLGQAVPYVLMTSIL